MRPITLNAIWRALAAQGVYFDVAEKDRLSRRFEPPPRVVVAKLDPTRMRETEGLGASIDLEIAAWMREGGYVWPDGKPRSDRRIQQCIDYLARHGYTVTKDS